MEEARALLAAGPGERIAILPAHAPPAEVAQTLAALANATGGTVLLTIEAGHPVDSDALLDKAVAAALSCDPPLILPLPQPVQAGSQALLVLTVPPGLPHVYAHEGVYWRREGDRNQALGPRPLRELLMAPPAGHKPVLGVDPGFRTGCKVVALDQTGKLLEYRAIYPHEPQCDTEGARKVALEMTEKHGIRMIAIGNGTASRETDTFIRDVISSLPEEKRPISVVVNESEIGRAHV